MNYSNMDIRRKAMENGVPLWKVAESLGMSESGFSRKMRYEMNDDDKTKVFQAIENVKNGVVVNG